MVGLSTFGRRRVNWVYVEVPGKIKMSRVALFWIILSEFGCMNLSARGSEPILKLYGPFTCLHSPHRLCIHLSQITSFLLFRKIYFFNIRLKDLKFKYEREISAILFDNYSHHEKEQKSPKVRILSVKLKIFYYIYI